MITEENLDTDSREIHYVCENGRVEGLILDKGPSEERTRRERPRSAKGRRRAQALNGAGVLSTSDSGDSCRTFSVESINTQGVQELFSDILYHPDNEDSSDTDNIGEYSDDFEHPADDDNQWSNNSPHLYSSSTQSNRSGNTQQNKYQER